MKNTPKEHDWLKRSMPHVNFNAYDLEDIQEKRNTKRHEKIYPTRLFVTIQEKNVPPDDS